MKKCLIPVLVSLLFFCCGESSVRAEPDAANWPQWRGADGNGISLTAEPPLEWSEKKNIKWKIPLKGSGNSTPVVWGDQIFVLSAAPGEGKAVDYWLSCYHRHTGALEFEVKAHSAVPHEKLHRTNTYSSGSPITDGKKVYAHFGSAGLYCYTMQGKLLWKRSFAPLNTRRAFGEGCSPTLSGNQLIIPRDHEGDSSLLVLDAQTGKTQWKVARDEPTTWATPLVVEVNGIKQVIVHGTTRIRSYDLKDGRLIWECGGQAMNPVATPVTDGSKIYCTTALRGYACTAISLTAKGDVTDTPAVAWHRDDFGSYVSSPLLHEGRLYVIKSFSAVLACLDSATGKTLWGPERLPGLDQLYASPVLAGGRLYFADRSGTTIVLKPGPEFEVLATNVLDEGVDGSPVPVGKDLILRGRKHLYCVSAAGAE